MRLAISKNSWHFKFYEFIIELWGGTCGVNPSLCRYSQTLFWGALGSIIASPFIIVGWCQLKLYRIIYKIFSKIPNSQKIVDFLDDHFKIYTRLDETSKAMDEAFGIVCIGVFVVTFLLVAVIVLFTALVTVGLPTILSWIVFQFLPVVPAAIWWGITHLGWLIFGIFSMFGFCLSKVGIGIVIAIKVIFSLVVFMLPVIIWWVLIFGLIMAIFYGIGKLLLSDMIKPIRDHFKFKLNGFQQAHKENVDRRAKEVVEGIKNIPASESKKPNKCIEFVFKWSEKIYEIFTGKLTKVGKESYKVVGGIGIVWTMVKAFLEEVCPFVEFIDDSLKEKKK